MDTKSLNDLPRLLQDLLRTAEASYPGPGHRVWEVWEAAVGPDVARRSYPLSLNRGRLVVAVSTAAWMQQLSFLRDRIRESVNEALGNYVVKDVRFRLAEVAPPPPPRQVAAPPPWLSDPLPQEILSAIEADVASIQDAELRASIRHARIRAEQAKRFREGRAAAPPQPNSASPTRGGRGET